MIFLPERDFRPKWVVVLTWTVMAAAVAGCVFILGDLVAKGQTYDSFLFWETVLILVVIVVSLYTLFAGTFMLAYKLEPAAIRVRGVFGWFSFPRQMIASLEIAPFTLTLRPSGIGVPGCLYGNFLTKEHGKVKVYAGKGEGAGVLINLSNGTKVILTPQDREGFLKAAAEQGYPLLTQATKGEGSYGETS